MPPAKPPIPAPLAVPSDDCEVAINGTMYRPHDGQTVWVWPGSSLRLLSAYQELTSLSSRTAVVQGDPDQVEQVARMTADAVRSLAAAVAPHLDHWDWTDLRGRPMHQPDGTIEPLMDLSVEELMWLSSAVQGETPAAKKNVTKPSPTSS